MMASEYNSLAHDYHTWEKHQPAASKCSFQLPSISDSSIGCPSQRSHSCCPPSNLHALHPANRLGEEFAKHASRGNNERCKFGECQESLQAAPSKGGLGGRGEDAETEDPLLPDEAESLSPFVKMALMDAEDNQH